MQGVVILTVFGDGTLVECGDAVGGRVEVAAQVTPAFDVPSLCQ
jgi:hypothetical protein